MTFIELNISIRYWSGSRISGRRINCMPLAELELVGEIVILLVNLFCYFLSKIKRYVNIDKKFD